VKQLKFTLPGILMVLLLSCKSAGTDNKLYCGYELTVREYDQLRSRVELQNAPYEADSLWDLYGTLNDSIRSVMPDSVEFEIFLSLLNANEIGLDVFTPDKKEFFEKIGCAVMNLNYTDKMPGQRYLFLYTYSKEDGSGEMPLRVAIKRKK
jgi:hypothetical protein